MKEIKTIIKEIQDDNDRFLLLEQELTRQGTLYIVENKEYNALLDALYKNCTELEDCEFQNENEEYLFYDVFSTVLFSYAQRSAYPVIMSKQESSIFNKDNVKLFSSEKIEEIISYFEKCIECLQKIKNYSNININDKIKNESSLFHCKVLYSYGVFLLFIGRVEDSIKYFLVSALPYGDERLGNAVSASYLIDIYTSEEYLDIKSAAYFYIKVIEREDKWLAIDNGVPIELLQTRAFCSMMDLFIRIGEYKQAKEICNKFKIKLARYQLYAVGVSEDESVFLETIENIVKNYEAKLNEIEKSNIVEDIYLVEDFDKETLKKMSGDIKVFITTSIRTFEFLKKENSKENNLDFSSAILPMMKALEILLEKLFAEDYFKFLQKEKNLNMDNIDKVLKVKDSKTQKYILKPSIEKLTLGDALHMVVDKTQVDITKIKLSDKNHNKRYYISPNYYFCKYCEKLGVVDVYSFVKEFGEDLDKIVILRNNTAHKKRILPTDADEAFELLLKTKQFIKKLYKNFGFCF